jgi:hypothetical protein
VGWKFLCLVLNSFWLFLKLFKNSSVPDMGTYQNKHDMLLNLPQCLSIFLLQTSKTDNNALNIDAIYNLKFKKKKQSNSTLLQN